MREGLSDDLAQAPRPTTSAPTSCGTSGSPLPRLEDRGVELHHLPSPNHCTSVSLLTEPNLSPLSPHLSALTQAHFVCVKTKQTQQKSHFNSLPLGPIPPSGQTHKSPMKMSSTINFRCLDKTFRKRVQVYQSTRPNAFQSSKHCWKTATLDVNSCGLSKSIQSNMHGDKAILPGGQIFQITSS